MVCYEASRLCPYQIKHPERPLGGSQFLLAEFGAEVWALAAFSKQPWGEL